MTGKRIAIDLTPLRPGGEMGGVKPLALELVRELGRLAPQDELILLTANVNHDELKPLDAANVRRSLVAKHKPAPEGADARLLLRIALAKLIPARVFQKAKRSYRSQQSGGLMKELGADLLFCPFTAPTYYDPAVPVVSLVVDLQFLAYPRFFSLRERFYRNEHFRDACRVSAHLIAISEFVRRTILESAAVDPAKVSTIHIGLHSTLKRVDAEAAAGVSRDFGLKDNRNLIYPANFWPHKNHIRLLEALRIFFNRYPDTDLKLVCTGAPETGLVEVQARATQLGLSEQIVFPGHLSREQFIALLQSSRALIFPSLYEGFGMPVLEAMQLDVPVLCSRATSLPEVAGDAALYFDPLSVAAIE